MSAHASTDREFPEVSVSTADTVVLELTPSDAQTLARVAAALILATTTTLADHVTVHDGDPIEVEITDDIPFETWGSGTQALWRLLCAVAYSGEQVSLYATAAPLDARNSAGAANALSALFGGTR